MIEMGAIIEFLLKKYCKKNNLKPEDYTGISGNTIKAKSKQFVNYVQAAIKGDFFGQRNSWHIVQNNLRNFRNYMHISKEIKEEKIDKDWYITIKPVFYRLVKNFQ